MSEQLFKLIENKDGDLIVKFRKNRNNYIYINPEDINSSSWDISFQWRCNRQEMIERCYEYLILNGFLEE